MPFKFLSRKFTKTSAVSTSQDEGPVAVCEEEDFLPAAPTTLASDPVKRALQLERYAWLLSQRDQWADHPEARTILKTAMEKMDEAFALVPEGYVSMPQTVNDYPGCPEQDFETIEFHIARCPVTNAQYQKFIDAGGYEDLSIWPQDVWPHLIDFVDLTGFHAPRFWNNGRHNQHLSDHPVVGICYYEAAAYARWAGLRLPTEVEWQMAASWRIRSTAQVLRRYPWGDALDIRRCNIWASNIGRTLPVTEYAAGGAPNGVLQLIGNVWEWTDADFNVTDSNGHPVVGEMILKSIRGGAFDTYFPSQATSVFRTGLGALFRVHNVGFRCACDTESPPVEIN